MVSPSQTDDGASAMELARNLPALVKQLQGLREDMERKTILYDTLLHVDSWPSSMSSDQTSGMHGSVFTPYANSQLDPRASQMSFEALSTLNDTTNDANYSNTLVSRRSSIMRQQQHRPSLRMRPQTRTHSMPNMSMKCIELDNYSVMWVSGDCGISLRNFSRKDTKVGAQIAVLQHTEGVTTGISNCRLGDQLMSINDDRVDQLRFKEIVERLKTAQLPIALRFRTNQNMQTSPRAASSQSDTANRNGGSRSSRFFMRKSKKDKELSPSLMARHSVKDNCTPKISDSDLVNKAGTPPGSKDVTNVPLRESILARTGAAALDRMTTASLLSSELTLPDDIERWGREQEEMHCAIIILLTETILRCEKLQQENVDQLQNFMQLSLCSSLFNDKSSVASSNVSANKTIKVDRSNGPDVDVIVSDAMTTVSRSVERLSR